MTHGDLSGDVFTGNSGLSRRDLLLRAGAAGLILSGGATLLSACGGDNKASGPQVAAFEDNPFPDNVGTPGNPSQGGQLRVAMTGAGTTEHFNPFIINTPIDTLHVASVFDPMIRPAPMYKRENGLVVDWTSNSDATEWELKLRDGVLWHDGKPLTPEDLIYTLRKMAEPTSFGSYAVAGVNLRDLKKSGKNSVTVPLKIPIADLQGFFCYNIATYIVQDGAKDFTKPVGTGPFKLQSFQPGQRAVLVKNTDYWDNPKPYVDELHIISIDDPTARLNALTSGQVDLALGLAFAEAKANLTSDNLKIVVGQPGVSYMLYMRCDSGSFKDVRVRKAMKLIADRPQMITTALAGFGAVGNDLVAPGVKFFDKSIPQREQNIDEAKSLLKAAGASDLRVVLNTAEVLPGFNDAATVFSQQAKAAGVTVQIKKEPISQYFNPEFRYLKYFFAQDAWPGPSLQNNYSLLYLKDSFINETHFFSDGFDKLFYRAVGELDPTKAQSLWTQVQNVQRDEGGSIVWAYWRATDGAANNVRGFGEAGSGWLYGSDDDRVWNWGFA